jgi:hypothetical protein
MRRIAIAAVSAVALTALLAGPALAGGKGGTGKGGGGTSTLTLVLLNSADGQAHYGQSVTFNVSSTVTSKPMVELDCFQAGSLVYTHSAGFYPDYPWPWLQTYNLSSTAWTSGAADCAAKLYYANNKGGFVTLKTLNFAVAA